MKILIVGGAGYVGGAVTDILNNDGHDIVVYDNLLYEDSYQKKVKFVFGDIRDYFLLKNLLKNFDCVVWMAALVGDGACNVNPSVTNQINYESVKFLSENFDGKIVFFSTCSVYGAQDGILNEKSTTNPLSIYASTKLKAEYVLKNKNVIIFRLGTLFGVGDEMSRIRMDLAVNTLTAKAFYEKKLSVFGGEQYRPLLHVKDAAYAIKAAIESKKVGTYDLHAQNMKILDLAIKIQNYFDDVKIEKIEIKFQDSRNYKVDGSKVREELNFKPRLSIEDGISEIKNLLQEGRIKNINNPRYTNQKFLEMFKSNLLFK
jgi:nucleoside-diphosphate-sugar epimerase